MIKYSKTLRNHQLNPTQSISQNTYRKFVESPSAYIRFKIKFLF